MGIIVGSSSSRGKMKGTISVSLEALPEVGSSSKIYLVPNTNGDSENQYDEYIWDSINNRYERLGISNLDITSKADKTELDLTNLNLETLSLSIITISNDLEELKSKINNINNNVIGTDNTPEIDTLQEVYEVLSNYTNTDKVGDTLILNEVTEEKIDSLFE